jgi:hypothetical protein
MIGLIKYPALFLCVIFLASCEKEFLRPNQYVKWLEDESNGLKVKKILGDFEFTLQYKPTEYVIFDQYKSDTLQKGTMDEKRKEYDGLQYYTFQIKANGSQEIMKADISNESEYNSRLEYFISPAQDDIMLVENEDTLPCVLYHFERSYGLSPMNNIVLGFEKSKQSSTADKLFIYNDQVLGTGPVKLTIQEKNIQNIPSIRYEQN